MARNNIYANITSRKVAEMINIPYRTLMDWFSKKLLIPDGYKDRKKTILWNPELIREAKQIVSFRKQGLSLQAIKKASNYLRTQGYNPFSSGVHYLVIDSDGKPTSLIKKTEEGKLFDVLKKPGQMIIPLLALDEMEDLDEFYTD